MGVTCLIYYTSIALFSLSINGISAACNSNADCLHGGDCIEGSCKCLLSHTGDNCEYKRCDLIKCHNGGICSTGVCSCTGEWFGKSCELNSCSYIHCLNGKCVNGMCECKSGCTGAVCQTCNGDVDKPCDSNPCLNNGDCQNNGDDYICACSVDFGGKNCQQDHTGQLLPYGLSYRDKVLYSADLSDDGAYRYKIPEEMEPIKYLCEEYRSLFIHTNGFVTFNKEFPANRIFDLPIKEDPLSLIAPLMTDIVLNSSPSGDSLIYYNSAVKPDDVRFIKAERRVRKYFQADQMVIITWHRVKPSPYIEHSMEKNTFQLVLLQNFKQSYILINYGGLSWNWNDQKHVIGYQGPELNGVFNRTISNKLSFTAPNTITRWAEPVHSSAEKCHAKNSTEYKCKNWIEKQEAALLNSTMYPCPCNTNQMSGLIRFDRINNYLSEGHSRPTDCFVQRNNSLTQNRECCYNSQGSLITQENLEAGSVLKWNPLITSQSYLSADYEPKQWCCKETDNCDKFYKLRPGNDCAGFVLRIRRSTASGDPHITTLDGFKYEFNGLGEYWMIQSSLYNLQARTKHTTDFRNQTTQATVFIGFALKDLDKTMPSPVVNILLNAQRSGMDMLLDGQLLNWQSYVESNPFVANSIEIYNTNGTANIYSDSGVFVSITESEELLNIKVEMLDLFQNDTLGLMGVTNGDQSDDLTTPDGDILPLNSTSKDIFHDFGEKWRINEEESMFFYKVKESYADYNDRTFTPLFSEDLNGVLANFTVTEQESVESLCKDNKQCRYDYILTRKESIAKQTLKFENEIEKEMEMLANNMPSLFVHIWRNGKFEQTNIWEVELGKSSNISVKASDIDGDDLELYAENLPEGSTWDNITGVMEWTPKDLKRIDSLRYYARDPKGSFDVKTVTIKICDCSGNGVCDYFVPISGYKRSDSYQVVKCICDSAWTGNNCDEDLDWCAVYQPCYAGQTCTDKTPKEQNETGLAYECSACPQGTEKEEGNKCYDIDECADKSTQECAQICVNTFMSYRCECKEGFKLQTDQKDCLDIDECNLNLDNCDHTCVNTEGSYSCSCYDGYTQESNGTCTANGPPLSQCSDLNCQHDCISSNGVVQCVCRRGYDLNQDRRTCSDIDECSNNLISCLNGNCENIQGSYRCKCDPGFKLSADPNICKECTNNGWGPECVNACNCKKYNTVCDPINGCAECKEGWTGGSCDQDVNECIQDPKICGYGDCVNTEGSYNCTCQEGFIFGEDFSFTCQAIDLCESATEQLCLHGGMCVFHKETLTTSCDCSTARGWTGEKCQTEIDGCESSPCLNGGSCEDKTGYFTCVCTERFYGIYCEKDLNICENSLDLVCLNGGTCIFHEDTFTTSCDCSSAVGWTGNKCQTEEKVTEGISITTSNVVPRSTTVTTILSGSTTSSVIQSTVSKGMDQSTTSKGMDKSTTPRGIDQSTTPRGIDQGTTSRRIGQSTTSQGMDQSTTTGGIGQSTTSKGMDQGTTSQGRDPYFDLIQTSPTKGKNPKVTTDEDSGSQPQSSSDATTKALEAEEKGSADPNRRNVIVPSIVAAIVGILLLAGAVYYFVSRDRVYDTKLYQEHSSSEYCYYDNL